MALLFDFESPIFEVACIARTLILMTDGDIWEDEDGPAVGWLGCKLWDIAKQLDALFRKKTEGEDRAE